MTPGAGSVPPCRAGPSLLRYASSLHLLDVLPDAVLIDDLPPLLDLPSGGGGGGDRRPGRDVAACKVLAVLHDAVVRRGEPGACGRGFACCNCN